MNHSCDVLDILNVCEVTRFFKAVESFHLHHLPDNFVSDLVTPFINQRHIDVINETGQFLTCWWAIGRADTFVNIALNSSLKQPWGGGGGEAEALADVFLNVVPRHVALDDDCLGCSLLANQEDGFALLG